jgi:hypothetical protein
LNQQLISCQTQGLFMDLYTSSVISWEISGLGANRFPLTLARVGLIFEA